MRKREIFVAAVVAAIAAGSGVTAVWANLGVMGHGDDAVPTLSVGPLGARRPASGSVAPSGSLTFSRTAVTSAATIGVAPNATGPAAPAVGTTVVGDHSAPVVDQGLAQPTMMVASAPDPTISPAANLPAAPGRDLVGQPPNKATTTTAPHPHTTSGRKHPSPPASSTSTTTRPPIDGRDD